MLELSSVNKLKTGLPLKNNQVRGFYKGITFKKTRKKLFRRFVQYNGRKSGFIKS